MPQVSLNFSAASLAIAADGPRPRMNSELCRGKRAGDLHPVAGDRLGEMRRQLRQAPQAARLSPVHSPRMASPATADATKVLVAATLFSAPERMSIAWSRGGGERRAGGVGDGDGQRAAVARGLGHGDDVGALARLRDGDAGRLRELQLGAVDRGDRRAERGDRNAGRELDGIFQEGGGVVRRAARDRGDEARVERSRNCGAGRGQRAARLVEQPRRGLRDFGDLAPHMGVSHLRASFALPGRSISTRRRNHRCRRDRSSG